MVAFHKMALRGLITRRNVIIGSAVLVAGLAVTAFFALRRPPRVEMERYVPASALAYIEVENLADIVGGLADTKAWREIGPALGISTQFKMVNLVADVIGRSGIGSDEVVAASRGQFAIALMGIDSRALEEDQGPTLQLKPRFAFIIETHARPQTADKLARELGVGLARRVYGRNHDELSEDYQGTRLLIFRSPQAEAQQPDRLLAAAASGSVIVIANHADAAKSCLDAIAGRAPTLADDATLGQMRPNLGARASVFAYVPKSGIEHLMSLAPVLIASRTPVDPESLASFTSLFDHLSKQAAEGLLYSSEFTSDGVVEKYLTVLAQPVAEGLAGPMKPAPGAGFESLQLIPRQIAGLTIWNVERIGELPERTLRSLTPRVDVVAGLALRQFVINLRNQYGVEPTESVGDVVGNEVALVDLGDGKSQAMLLRVKDKERLAENVFRYIRRGGADASIEQYKEVEIALSSSEDGRAAAFVGSFLVLGTRDQIVKVIEARASKNSIAGDERLKQALGKRPATATVFSYRPDVTDSAELMLAVSKLTRATDGSPELLEQNEVQAAMARVPAAFSFTEFREYGIYIETRSAVGSFSLLGSLIGRNDQP